MEQTTEIINSLSFEEQSELEEYEKVIERGLTTFVEVGNALAQIRDKHLYRQVYSTFENYCQEKWQFTDRYARQLIASSEVVENIKSGTTVPNIVNDTISLPQNEFQTRPLTQLEPKQQLLAWQEAVNRSNGKPTSTQVQQVVQEFKQQAELIKPEIIPVISKKLYYTIEEWNLLSTEQRQDITSQKGDKQFNKQDSDNIEWARWSWNPITGCLHNCAYCYARDIANRFYTQGFEPTLIPDRLTAPQNTKLPDLGKFSNSVDRMGWRNVFTCSMADLFGKWVPQEWIEAVLEQVKNNPQWTFLFLTKFPIRMAEFEYPKNVWLGTTVDYQWAVERAEKAFRKIKASGFEGTCWLSCEPMMERLTFTSLEMFDWTVIGGSSRSTQTPEFKPPREWINHLENQAIKANSKIYEKTNLLERIREYPGIINE